MIARGGRHSQACQPHTSKNLEHIYIHITHYNFNYYVIIIASLLRHYCTCHVTCFEIILLIAKMKYTMSEEQDKSRIEKRKRGVESTLCLNSISYAGRCILLSPFWLSLTSPWEAPN